MSTVKDSRPACPEPKYRVEVNLDPFAPREKLEYVYEMPSSPSDNEKESGVAEVPIIEKQAESTTKASDSTQSENKVTVEETESKKASKDSANTETCHGTENPATINDAKRQETSKDAEKETSVGAENKHPGEPQETFVVETLMNTDFEGKLRIYRPEPHVLVPEVGTFQYMATMPTPSFPGMGTAPYYPNVPFPDNYPYNPDYQRYNGHWGYPEMEQDNINWWRYMHQYYSQNDWMNPGYDFSRQFYEQRYYQQRFPFQESGDYGYGYLQRYDRHGQGYNSPRFQPYYFDPSTPGSSGHMGTQSHPENSVYSGSGRSEQSVQSPSTHGYSRRESDDAGHSTGHGSPQKRHEQRRRGRTSGHGQGADETAERLPVSETAIKQMRECLSDLKKKIAHGRRRSSSRSAYRWNCRVKSFIEENLRNALSVNKSLGKRK